MVINEIKIKVKTNKKEALKTKPTVKPKKPLEKKPVVVNPVLINKKTLAPKSNTGNDLIKLSPTPVKAVSTAPVEMINLQPSKNETKVTPLKSNAAIRQAILDELNQTPQPLVEKKVKQPKQLIKKSKNDTVAKIPAQKPIAPAIIPKPTPIKIRKNCGKKILTFLIIFFILIVGIAANIYFYPLNKISKTAGKILPIPALIINNQTVYLADVQDDYLALQKYLSRQDIPTSVATLISRVKTSLIEKTVINALAAKQNINVSDNEIANQINSLLTNQQDIGTVSNLVKELYGWDLPLYQKKVLKPLLQANKLNEAFDKANNQPEIKEALNNFLAKIKEDPKQFDLIASAVNEDSSRYTAGDLGWIIVGDTAPEFEAGAIQLKEGEVSEVIETAYGYHIIKLLEKNINADDKQIFHIAHIFLKKKQFNDYLSNEIKKAKVISLIKID